MTLLNTVQLNAQGSLKNVILDTTQLSQNGKKIKKKLLRFYLLVKNAMVIVSAHVHELNSLTVLLLAGQTQR